MIIIIVTEETVNKGCTRDFLYNYITALDCICIEISAYTLYLGEDYHESCYAINIPQDI